MKDFTKIAQAASIQANSKEISILDKVAREWQIGQAVIDWQVIPTANKQFVENMSIVVKIFIAMSVLYSLFFMLPPLFSMEQFGAMGITLLLVNILTVAVEVLVIMPLLLKWVRSNRFQAINIHIDRTAKQVSIRRPSSPIQTVAFDAKNVVLPAFRLPENCAGQYHQLKDSLQSKITAETGLSFEEIET